MEKRSKDMKKIIILGVIGMIFIVFLLMYLLVPFFKLKGDKELTLEVNSKYNEQGYLTNRKVLEVSNNVDTSKIGTYYVFYKYKDHKEIKEKIRIVNIVDTTSPNLELMGKTKIDNCSKSYKEEGYAAIDNYDGDLTSKVEKEITDDKIIYKVKDKSGNEAKEVRKVTVYTPKKCFSSVTTGTPGVIYLTFDDGPSVDTTARLLDILKEENVKATFFLTDKINTDYLIKRMYDEGHTIGLHTASHNYKYVYSSTTNFFKDIEKIKEKVARVTGESPTIIRFPGGSSNTVSSFNPGIMCTLSNMAIEKGYHYFDWNVSSGDAGSGRSKKSTYQNVTNNLSKKRANIVLMHDIYGSTVDAVKDIIKYGKDNGYTFEKITMDTEMYTHYVNN